MARHYSTFHPLELQVYFICRYIIPTMMPRMKTYPKIGGPLKRETGDQEGRKESNGKSEPWNREIDGNSKSATGDDCGTRRSVRGADSGKTGRRRDSNKSDSIKAVFLAACEQGDLEKVFNASDNDTWSQDHKLKDTLQFCKQGQSCHFTWS